MAREHCLWLSRSDYEMLDKILEYWDYASRDQWKDSTHRDSSASPHVDTYCNGASSHNSTASPSLLLVASRIHEGGPCRGRDGGGRSPCPRVWRSRPIDQRVCPAQNGRSERGDHSHSFSSVTGTTMQCGRSSRAHAVPLNRGGSQSTSDAAL